MAKDFESQHRIVKGKLPPLQTKINLGQHSDIFFLFNARYHFNFTVSRVFGNETEMWYSKL